MRVFVRVREMQATHEDLARRVTDDPLSQDLDLGFVGRADLAFKQQIGRRHLTPRDALEQAFAGLAGYEGGS